MEATSTREYIMHYCSSQRNSTVDHPIFEFSPWAFGRLSLACRGLNLCKWKRDQNGFLKLGSWESWDNPYVL